MEEQVVKKGMSTGAVIGIAVLVAIVFGGGVYAYVNNKATKEKKDLNAQITELQSQVSSAKTVTPSASASATADETADWKTYMNDKYSYSIKYPTTGWTTYNDDEKVADSQRVSYRLANYQFNYDPGYSIKSGEAVIFVSTNSTNQSLAQIVSSYAKKTKKTINGAEFYLVDRTNENSDEGGQINDLVYIAVKNGVEYTIQLVPASPGASIVNTFNQIANTFQFTK